MSRSQQRPLITVAVPSLNQGRHSNDALQSIFAQDVPVEVFVADDGSTDNTTEILGHWEAHLAGWRSAPHRGQAAAINECVAKGTAPYVAWLNSDDLYLPNGLRTLENALEQHANSPVAYGRTWNVNAQLKCTSRIWAQPFSEKRLATRCIVSQPATLIRRKDWEAVGSLDESLHMALDYDLWWRLYRRSGPLGFADAEVALNRDHDQTKTQHKRHYREAIAVVRKHHGSVPVKWWLAWPVSVWARSWMNEQKP